MDACGARKLSEAGDVGPRGVAGTIPGLHGAASSRDLRLGKPDHRAIKEAPNPPSSSSSTLCERAVEALEEIDRAVLLLDTHGVVQHMNRLAQAMVSRGHGLAVQRGRLTLAAAADTAAFGRCLEHRSESLLLRTGGECPAHRAYVVHVIPHPGPGASGGFTVFIYEPPGKQRQVHVGILRELYGLTAAEARLANALYLGQTLQVAAMTGGISVNTAKSVLKKIFLKCEVGSQAELLQLLALGPKSP